MLIEDMNTSNVQKISYVLDDVIENSPTRL